MPSPLQTMMNGVRTSIGPNPAQPTLAPKPRRAMNAQEMTDMGDNASWRGNNSMANDYAPSGPNMAAPSGAWQGANTGQPYQTNAVQNAYLAGGGNAPPGMGGGPQSINGGNPSAIQRGAASPAFAAQPNPVGQPMGQPMQQPMAQPRQQPTGPEQYAGNNPNVARSPLQSFMQNDQPAVPKGNYSATAWAPRGFSFRDAQAQMQNSRMPQQNMQQRQAGYRQQFGLDRAAQTPQAVAQQQAQEQQSRDLNQRVGAADNARSGLRYNTDSAYRNQVNEQRANAGGADMGTMADNFRNLPGAQPVPAQRAMGGPVNNINLAGPGMAPPTANSGIPSWMNPQQAAMTREIRGFYDNGEQGATPLADYAFGGPGGLQRERNQIINSPMYRR